MTVDFAKEYLLDDCADCPENKNGECMTQSHCFEVKRMAIQALEQEPCEDAISREWLKTAIHNFYYGLKHTPTEEDIQAYIDAAPSVSTEKTGRWEKHSYFKDAYICSACNTGGNMVYKDFKYCPNCGAKMEVEE